MAQGNPFQDWGGGQSASDDPFSQFPFQHPKTQQGVSDPVQGQPLQLLAPTTYAPAQGPPGQHMTPRSDLSKLQPTSGVGDSVNPSVSAKDNPFDSVFGHGPLAGGPPASTAYRSQQGGAGGNGLGGGAGAPTSSTGLAGPSSVFTGGVGHQPSIRTVPHHQIQPQAHLQPQATQHPSNLTLQQPSGHDGILVPYRNQQQADQISGSLSIGADGGAVRGIVGGGGMRVSTPDGPAPSPTGVGPSAMVPFGHPFASPQHQQPAQGARRAAHVVAQGSLVPFSPGPNQSQQQNQGWGHQGGVVGVAGGVQSASNPFDDLFPSNVPATTPRGNPGFTTSGVIRQPQPHPPQQKPQHWNVQQYQTIQHQHPKHQHQVQEWSPVSKGVEGLTISARDHQPVVTRGRSEEYSPFHNNQGGQQAWQKQAPSQGWPSHPQQIQQKERMQQQPQYGSQYPGGQAFLGSSPQPPNRSFSVDAYNPFFSSSPGGKTQQQQAPQPKAPQQVTPTAGRGDPYPGSFDIFSDDPFRANKSALTTTDEGFIALGGRSTTVSPPGSGGGPNSTPQKPPDSTNTGSGDYAPSAPSSAVSAADPFDPFDIPSTTPKSGGNADGAGRRGGSAAVARGRWAGRSAASTRLPTARNSSGIFSSKSSSDDRPGRDTGRQKRSSSVPRIPEGRTRSPESDPFNVNTGRHALGGRSLDDSDRGGGGGGGGGSNGSSHEGSSFGRKNSFSRSHTMGDLSEPGRGRGNPRESGSRGMGGGSVVRGRSQRSFHSRARQEEEEEDDDDGLEDAEEDEEEENLGGSDSDNDDSMSVMDPDAMRAAMGRRRGGHGAGGREGNGRNWRGHGNGGEKDGSGAGPLEYVVEFERERKLGMLLERHDEWAEGSEARSERAVVKMVVDNGPAQTRGVTVGSKVKKVNGESVTSLTYQETLERIKHASRPLRVHFERGELVVDDNAGLIMFKKTVGVPLSYSAWQRRFYVLGGAVAKSHVLQIYGSKQSYDRMVLAVFGRQRINERVKAYKLNYQFKCGPIRVKKHKAHPSPLHYFTIKIPTSRLKQLNFASHSLSDLEHLRNSISRYTSKS